MRGRLRILTKQDGTIIALLPASSVRATGQDAPAGVTVLPLPGQRLHELEIPAAIARLAAGEILTGFKFRSGKLVRREQTTD